MRLALPIVWSDRHRLHEPGGEVWVGVRTPGTEVPRRADAIRDALEACDAPFVDAAPHPDDDVLAVHDRALLDYLRGAWDAWVAAGLPDDPGHDRVVPYVFAHPGLTAHLAPAEPAATWARPGYFAYDTMTLVGPGTYQAARAAVDAALTAADLVAIGTAPADYACCRPGHHVTRSAHGGSCYLNNAAAAAALVRRLGGPVAVLDIDAHHGNGTQAIFYDRGDVLTGSAHVDPGAGWFPTSSAWSVRQGPVRAPAPTATCRSPPATATTPGWTPSRRSCPSRRPPPRRPSSSRSASTPRPAIPRARCACPGRVPCRRARARRASCADPFSSRSADTTWTRSAPSCEIRSPGCRRE
jgi:hypothetical protein